ncbi:hypothetical protein PIB30_061304 [Stylosanthes scabra]|uniref:Uncharacterized protein n=1 Tax=Stylosanthes scabra TaxID=79078 RepID=A0ABU6ZJK9_9FABA|nr:hypothetical protein [Stylosanthes scabra]
MGNSPPSSLRPYNGDQPSSVAIHHEFWKMKYKVHNLTCKFDLTSAKETHGKDYVCITTKYIPVSDSNELQEHLMNSVKVQRDEAGALHHRMDSHVNRTLDDNAFHRDRINNTMTNEWGGITETNIELHEHGRMRFMLVMEWKKRSNKSDGKPYMLSVTHYYASLDNGKDVGLSMQIKRIKAKSSSSSSGGEGGGFDFTVDGPHLRPANALFYMYDEIIRSRKPTCCPHCANNILQNLRMSYPSESEDSDIDTAVLPLGRSQHAGEEEEAFLKMVAELEAIIMAI